MKAQGNIGMLLMSFLVAFVFFMIGMIYVNPINSVVDSARSDLTCSAAPSTLSSGNMMLCLIFDLLSPVFIIAILSVVMGLITARLLI